MPWNDATLTDIADSDDLHISPFREDGRTYGTPTWIWSVVVDDELYVRAYNGQASRWHQAAATQHAGRIRAGGHTLEVTFTPADPAQQYAIDDAYRHKYAGSPYLAHMVQSRAQGATVRIDPR